MVYNVLYKGDIAMEIKRKIYSKLLKWKQETNGSKALLIEGARRIGNSGRRVWSKRIQILCFN